MNNQNILAMKKYNSDFKDRILQTTLLKDNCVSVFNTENKTFHWPIKFNNLGNAFEFFLTRGSHQISKKDIENGVFKIVCMPEKNKQISYYIFISKNKKAEKLLTKHHTKKDAKLILNLFKGFQKKCLDSA